MCIYICMYVCSCLYVCLYVFVCAIYPCMYVYIYIHISRFMFIHVYIYIHIHVDQDRSTEHSQRHDFRSRKSHLSEGQRLELGPSGGGALTEREDPGRSAGPPGCGHRVRNFTTGFFFFFFFFLLFFQETKTQMEGMWPWIPMDCSSGAVLSNRKPVL